MKRFFSVIPGIFLLFQFSCKSHQNGVSTGSGNQPTASRTERIAVIEKPSDLSYVRPGDGVDFEMKIKDDRLPDSTIISAGGSFIARLGKGETNARLSFKEMNPGEQRLLVRIFFSDSISESHTLRLRLVSDIQPVKYGYKLIRSYPHDKSAYTQGLEYADGYLYEGTGNYGKSSLRKVKLESGEIMKYRDLSSEFFGEGITRMNSRIYQITYREQVGFVYDEASFEPVRKIYYQNREGWGLCNDGKNILMSDGSHVIYFMDTTYFGVERKIEVYDNEKEVDLLNELELIHGKLYANRYTTNEIVIIDPETGKVTGKIDMGGLLDPADRHPSIDYFNGIAWDKKNDRIFVTGKHWPKLYEVEFIRK